MSSTYTTNLGLAKPGANDPGWDATLNGDFDALDAYLGNGAVRRAEHPSASLNVRVGAATFVKLDGTVATTTSATLTLGASTTTYIYIDSSGTLASSAVGFPAVGAGHVRLAVVVTGPSTVTSVTDARLLLETIQYRRAGAAQVALTDSTGGNVTAATLVDVGASYNQANLNNNFARIAVLLNELRAAMVAVNAIKGSA